MFNSTYTDKSKSPGFFISRLGLDILTSYIGSAWLDALSLDYHARVHEMHKSLKGANQGWDVARDEQIMETSILILIVT